MLAAPILLMALRKESRTAMRLLLVEDNIRLALFVQEGLNKSGFKADPVHTAEDGLAVLKSQNYDLVILDLGLPDRDGLALLKDIRGINKNIPVLILTARDALEDRLKGLDGGADDYLLKPFAIEELAARIRALLRRPGQSLGTILETGNVKLNTETRTGAVADRPLRLSRRELDLLEQLLRGAGQVISKERIEERLYSYSDEGSANSIEVLVHRLRQKLEKNGARVQIHTLRGIGYLLDE
jgi:two-component system OmpR family response regulator